MNLLLRSIDWFKYGLHIENGSDVSALEERRRENQDEKWDVEEDKIFTWFAGLIH